jgi:type IV pilus assembly protein PilF
MKRLAIQVLISACILLLAACSSTPEKAREYAGGVESDSQERARIHTELGAGYYAQNQLSIALEEFKEAIRIDSNYAYAYNGLGLVYGALKEDAKADASFKKSLQLEPNNSESHNNYGSFLCSRGRIDESIRQFMEAVSNPLYTTPGMAYMNAGFCSLRKNDEKNAEIYLQKAIIAQPILSQAAYQLALIQFNRGQVGLASDTLQNSLANNPSPEILWLGIRIARVMGDRNAEASYALLLRKKYPNSEQSKALLSGQQ